MSSELPPSVEQGRNGVAIARTSPSTTPEALITEKDCDAALGPHRDELVFHDLICARASEVTELSYVPVPKIVHKLVGIARSDAKTDWSAIEQVCAKLRYAIKGLLAKFGYLPDDEPGATQLVLEHAEVLAGVEGS